MLNQEERAKVAQGSSAKNAGPSMTYQEGVNPEIGSGAQGATTYSTEAQAPTFSKEGAYTAQEGTSKPSGATSGVGIETNVPLTSTEAERSA